MGRNMAPTLLHVLNKGLQFRDALCFLPQGIQDDMVVGRTHHVRLPQLAL